MKRKATVPVDGEGTGLPSDPDSSVVVPPPIKTEAPTAVEDEPVVEITWQVCADNYGDHANNTTSGVFEKLAEKIEAGKVLGFIDVHFTTSYITHGPGLPGHSRHKEYFCTKYTLELRPQTDAADVPKDRKNSSRYYY